MTNIIHQEWSDLTVKDHLKDIVKRSIHLDFLGLKRCRYVEKDRHHPKSDDALYHKTELEPIPSGRRLKTDYLCGRKRCN